LLRNVLTSMEVTVSDNTPGVHFIKLFTFVIYKRLL
jgi:hypothetical protein